MFSQIVVYKLLKFRNFRSYILAGLLLISSGVSAAPTAYTDETEFHNALALLGYTATHEGFEDDTAWGGVRSFITSGFKTAPSISNLGTTTTASTYRDRLSGRWRDCRCRYE